MRSYFQFHCFPLIFSKESSQKAEFIFWNNAHILWPIKEISCYTCFFLSAEGENITHGKGKTRITSKMYSVVFLLLSTNLLSWLNFSSSQVVTNLHINQSSTFQNFDSAIYINFLMKLVCRFCIQYHRRLPWWHCIINYIHKNTVVWGLKMSYELHSQLSISTPRSLSIRQLSSHSSPGLGLLWPKCRTQNLARLKLTQFTLVHLSSLFRSLCSAFLPSGRSALPPNLVSYAILEYLHRRRHNSPGQLVSELCHPHNKVHPHVCMEIPVVHLLPSYPLILSLHTTEKSLAPTSWLASQFSFILAIVQQNLSDDQIFWSFFFSCLHLIWILFKKQKQTNKQTNI